jgi:SAM-dependent MidA family methyltransferase
MDLALYHPQLGYYTAHRSKIGATGDFFTSPHLGADFGELLAEQLVEIWERLHRPTPFTLVEMGAGQGLLAGDVLRYLQRNYLEIYRSVEYLIVERVAVHIAEQQWQLRDLLEAGISLRWLDLTEIALDSVTGCFFSNELVDAFPVHQVAIESGQLREVYVTVGQGAAGDDRFSEITANLSTPQLASYFGHSGIILPSQTYPDGYRTEVNLAALDWMQTVADRLHRGYVLTIDYGYPVERYYHPARSQGTLQCYYQHAHHSDPYRHVGQQDITAHVNFTALERQGEQYGLQTVGFTKQALFLMALGLGDRIAAISHSSATDPQEVRDVLRQRQSLQMLIDPMGLGNFGVLIQSKSVERNPLLCGLQGETI